MRLLTTVASLLMFAWHSVALADETQAVQIMQEVVSVFETDLARMQRLAQRGVISPAKLQDREFELLEAQIQLAELQRDDQAITEKLQRIISIREHQQASAHSLHKKNVISDSQVVKANGDLLHARLRMAKHNRDQASMKAIIDQLVQLEREQLDRSERLAKQIGENRDQQIAKQKLRLATLLVEQHALTE